jgi:hypothetical protein
VELQENLDKIRKQGLGVAAISYDSVEVLKDFAARQKIAYPLLSDAESKTIRAFGLLNESVSRDTPQFGIPYPGTFVVDAKGLVTSKYFEQDFRQRHTASEIIVRQFGGKGDALVQTEETKHLKLSSSASQGVARWGERIALVVELELKRGMHVYARGAAGYIPIEWKIAATPVFQGSRGGLSRIAEAVSESDQGNCAGLSSAIATGSGSLDRDGCAGEGAGRCGGQFDCRGDITLSGL